MSQNYNSEFLPREIIQSMKKNIYLNYFHLTTYSDINQNYFSQRESLFYLIHKVSNKMNFKSNTYFLSIYLFDVVFLKNKIPSIYKDNYELLGLTCLVLAAKNLENDPTVPHLQYFVNVYNYIITKNFQNSQNPILYEYHKISFDELMLSEVIVIKMLNYKLNYYTIYDFNSFFFGHGILKIEQLKDICDDFSSQMDENNIENEIDNDELNHINPIMVKNILEKIYKKSRFYLDNVVKNEICLKYDSFLISIYIMYKSVENIILKENKILGSKKKQEKHYIEKKEEKLKKKTLKCFKEIMNDIYDIDLDSIEEYQCLINENDFIKIFYPLKFDNNISQNNNNGLNITEKLGIIHRKIQSNVDLFGSNNKIQKSETIESKEFSPKKVTMKVPSEKYNKIRRLKIMERLNNNTRTSKNKKAKLFLRMNSNERISSEGSGSISLLNRNKDTIRKSNFNLDISDINYSNNNKKDNKYKKLSLNNPSDKFFEPYSGRTNNPDMQYSNNFLIRSTNLKETLKNDNNLYHFPTLGLENEMNIDKNIVEGFNPKSIKNKSVSKKNLISVNQKTFKKGQNDKNTLKPYSKKVIPKIEKKSKINKIGKNIIKNMDKSINYKFKNIDINRSLNEISYKLKNYNDFDLRSSNINNYKNDLLGNNLDTSMEAEEKEKYSNNINSKYHKFNLNLSKKKNLLDNSTSRFPKFKDIPFLKSDYKKSSISVNKIKVNGVSSKNKYKRKLLFGIHKTPMKSETNLKKALKRNFGVKRVSNNDMSINSKRNSINNSIEKNNKNKENDMQKNKDTNNNNSIGYSCINLSSKKNTINNKVDNDINFSDKKLLDLKNNIIRNIIEKKIIKNNDKIKNNNYKRIEQSSSSDEYEENNIKENEKNYMTNDVKINIEQNGYYDVENFIDDMKYSNSKRFKIKKIYDNNIDSKNIIGRNNPKIELIQINKRKSPTIVINNNINVNFDNKSIEVNKFKNLKIK